MCFYCGPEWTHILNSNNKQTKTKKKTSGNNVALCGYIYVFKSNIHQIIRIKESYHYTLTVSCL